MFKKNKKEDIVSILNKNIIILKEISRARTRIKILQKTTSDSILNCKDEAILQAYGIYKERFKKPLFSDLISIFLNHVEEFEFHKYTSVPQAFKVQYRENESRFLKLGKINLKDHSLRVFTIACSKNKNNPDRFAEEIVLLALTHDFGKCNKVIDFVGSSAKETHNQVSAHYVSIIMRQLGYPEEFVELFYQTLYHHHSHQETIKNTFYIQALNECDYEARREEEKKIMKLEGKQKGAYRDF
ncbi:hypothetical protein BKH42_03505 [Helicobacter sp. 13S00482-2]|uniref:HD domain-containing protein n=1 Tax=Helicobacter sp. 13S00482-2 TaxID=1476200 RepID=UPI000BC6091F|nr:HD domain-containing protein [Helicobacter sp. 13S00482-2]PAF53807.1 hypothetical protein BKH42_03505 [Helicobacter sp. 13S00482-2]